MLTFNVKREVVTPTRTPAADANAVVCAQLLSAISSDSCFIVPDVALAAHPAVWYACVGRFGGVHPKWKSCSSPWLLVNEAPLPLALQRKYGTVECLDQCRALAPASVPSVTAWLPTLLYWSLRTLYQGCVGVVLPLLHRGNVARFMHKLTCK